MSLTVRTLFLALSALLLAMAPAWGQMKDNQERTLSCSDHNNWGNKLVSHCEIKEQLLPASGGVIQIDPGTNGGLTVKGWSRNEVLVRARIETAAHSDAEAKAMVGQIRFASGAGQIKSEGPTNDRDQNWSVSYEVFAPNQSDINAHAHNGGIKISDIKGHIEFNATNGGVHLSRIAGDVSGRTANGGLTIELAGDHWDGKGMDVATTNGGVKLALPANYSAKLETATVNGNISVDFPVTVQGRITKEMSFSLGNGGSTIRAVTTNGGVKIQKL